MTMRSLRIVVALSLALGLCCVPDVEAQPSAEQVLSDLGFSSDVTQRVLTGEFVTTDIPRASDEDLAIAIAFLVKVTPEALRQQVLSGGILAADSQVQASGEIGRPGSLADLAGLTITAEVAAALTSAEPGDALNLGTTEIAAFDALQGGTVPSVQRQLQQMLLTRAQAYRTSGLGGIAPYARSGGSTDVAGELRKASTAATTLAKYMPAFQQVLTGYPQATVPGMQERFHWVTYGINGTTTFTLMHTLTAAEGTARVVAQRQYYVSTGYNAEQAIAGFLPVQQGTLVVYTNHTFTDQVTGFGGAMKRDIGRRMMASKLEQAFATARSQIAQ